MSLIRLKDGQTGPSAVQHLKQVFDALQVARTNLAQLRSTTTMMFVVVQNEDVQSLLAQLDTHDMHLCEAIDSVAEQIGQHAVNIQAVQQAVVQQTTAAESAVKHIIGSCETQKTSAQPGSEAKPLKALLEQLKGKSSEASGGSLPATPDTP